MADEGAGVSLTFATSGITLDLLSVNPSGLSRADINLTHHGTTGGFKVYQPGDRQEGGSLGVSFLYDPNNPPPTGGAKELITLTYPVPSGDNNGATEAFQGYINNTDKSGLEIDARMEGSITIKVAGAVSYTTSST